MVSVGRLITAMVTPFDGQGQVDYAQAKRLASSLLESGSDGLVVSGTTGESPTLTKEEKLRLFREIKTELGDRGAVVAGTGNYSTAESIELTQEAEREGADAALLVVPYYNKPTQEGLYQHFKAIAESTRLPCILYNVPSRTITSLAWETTVKLAQVDNIIGVKEASGDLRPDCPHYIRLACGLPGLERQRQRHLRDHVHGRIRRGERGVSFGGTTDQGDDGSRPCGQDVGGGC